MIAASLGILIRIIYYLPQLYKYLGYLAVYVFLVELDYLLLALLDLTVQSLLETDILVEPVLEGDDLLNFFSELLLKSLIFRLQFSYQHLSLAQLVPEVILVLLVLIVAHLLFVHLLGKCDDLSLHGPVLLHQVLKYLFFLFIY